MSEQFIKEFKQACKENREYLGYSYKQMASYLDNVSEEEYYNFENKDSFLSKDNIKRVIRILCIEKPKEFDIEECIDTQGLSEEEIEFFANVIRNTEGE